MLLMAYRQPATIGAAIAGALAQSYSPLEIVVSDDHSDDGGATWAAIEAALAGYTGPHRIVVNRNPANLGIGAHISRLVELARGELLVVTAGDDVSLPSRCARIVQAWEASGRQLDLIASALVDLDAAGGTHGVIVPSDLAALRDAADWLAHPPFVVGAAQAWTRRLFTRFGPLRAGVVGEDLIMVFRAVVSGGALTLPEPLVQYRRGGISRRVRNLYAADVVARLRKNSRGALAELPQLLADAQLAGVLDSVGAELRARLAREQLVHDLFEPGAGTPRLGALIAARAVPASTRLRLAVYALCPWLLAPFFFLKRLVRGARRTG